MSQDNNQENCPLFTQEDDRANISSNSELFNDLQIDNLPNRLTIFRVVLIPVIIGCLFFTSKEFVGEQLKINLRWIAGWTFVIASITDFFDGYIARKRNIQTVFGSFLDPIADKFLTVSSLIMLGSLGKIPAIIVIILVLREMYMTSLRLLASTEQISVPVNQMGKWKTGLQMFGIPLVMANETWWVLPLNDIGSAFIYSAFILSIWSAIIYTGSMINKLKERRMEKKLSRKKG